MAEDLAGLGYGDPLLGSRETEGRAKRDILIHFREAGLRDAVLETQERRLAPLRTYLRLGFVPEYREADDRRRWSRIMPRVLR